ncbi:MAG: sulfatase [Thermoplasmata archaeon]|nr:sulfatase [Thermoplasmata archaeon]
MTAVAAPPPVESSTHSSRPSVGASPRTTAPGRPPNVVVVVLDCARAKSFGLSGGERTAHTPVLDALARRGTVFPNAVAPANWTVPSHMSMFTGEYPGAHGRRTFQRGPAPRETTASWLGRRGYETALFTEMVHLVAGYGLEDGYTRRVARHIGLSDEQRTTANWIAQHSGALDSGWMRSLLERVPQFIVPMNFVNHRQEVAFKQDVCGSYVPETFDIWLAQRDRRRPFHAFVNLVDAHEPYPIIPNGHAVGPVSRWYARTPRYYLLSVRGLQGRVPWDGLLNGYHWSIEQADAKVGQMLESLRRAGEEERTLVIVTSDHGQSFGESGNVFHGCGATDSITRVPLIVAPPLEHSLPGRVERWTSLCDLPSWVKAAASGHAPFDEQGIAPLPFSAGAPSPDTVFCEGAPASDPNRSLRGVRLDATWNHRLLAAYRGPDKFVLDVDTSELVRWSMTEGDPDSRIPERLTGAARSEVRHDVFDRYRGLQEIGRGPRTPDGPTDTEIDRRLRSWGYD